MSSVTVRLMAGLWLTCLLMMAGSVLAGNIIPSAPVIVGIKWQAGATELRMVDTRLNTVYLRRFNWSIREWSKNYCRIALVPELKQVIILDTVSGRWRRFVLPGHLVSYNGAGVMRWSYDNRRLAVSGIARDGTAFVAVMDTLDWSIRYLAQGTRVATESGIDIADWSLDSRQLIYSTDAAYMLDTSADQTRRLTDYRITGWRSSADGRYVLAAGVDPLLVDTATGETADFSQQSGFDAFELATAAWSPDGHRLAVQGNTDEKGIWQNYGYVFEPGTNTLAALTAVPLPTLSPVWSPDGTMLVYFSWTNARFLQTYIVDSRSGNLIAEEQTYRSMRAVWSPNSRYLLMVGIDFDRYIRVLDTRTGQIMNWYPPAGQYMLNPQWLADSRTFSYVITANGIDASLQLARIEGEAIHLSASYSDTGSDARVCLPEETDT